MRNVMRIAMILCCLLALGTVVFADNSVTGADVRIDITSEGTAQVSANFTLRLDSAEDKVSIPVPASAKNVILNGASARTYQSSFDSRVNLADVERLKGATGEYTVSVQYSIPSVLSTEKKTTTKVWTLYVDLPMISGFSCPVQSVNFNITLPAMIQNKPSFVSSYRQTGVESIMDVTTAGNVIIGRVVSPLQDKEGMSMKLEVDEKMFPGKLQLAREGNPEVIPMGICAALALVYWIVFLRTWPTLPRLTSTPPDGLNAGELGSRLTMAGVDLTMLVFSWASLGYLRICPDRYGRVFLQKRMEMGNERSEFENRCFQALFGKNKMPDATGTYYANLCRKTALTVSGSREIMTRHSGSVRVLRMLLCGIHVFAGICFAMNLQVSSTLQILLAIALALIGAVDAWGIQGGPYRLFLRNKQPLIISLVCAGVWMIFGAVSGQILIGAVTVLGQLAGGFFAAYGGRRSELGRYQAGKILGLRKFLKHPPKEELRRLVEQNPDYFHELMPYALALGVDRQFARQFDGMRIPPCSYLTARDNPRRTAREWAALMRTTADRMDMRQRRMEREKWTIVSIQRSRR